MSRRLVPCVALLLLALSPLLNTARPAQAATWASTATQGLTLANATSLGALPTATPLHIVVGLALRNQAALSQYIARINTPGDPLYGQQLSPDQGVAAYGPSGDQTQAVVSYLTGQGFTNIQVEPNNLLISADGSAGSVQTAFNTQMGQFLQNGQTVYANTTPAQVPAALGGIVVAVLGLTDAGRMSTPHRIGSGVPPSFYGPKDFWKAYDVGTTPTGAGTNMAVFAQGDLGNTVKALRIAEANFRLPQVPVQVVHVGLVSPDTSNDIEWKLDTQYTSGMAGNAHTLYIYASTTLMDPDISLAFSRFQTQDVAKVGNASFGECESLAYLDGAMQVDDMLFNLMAAQGQTVFASSGDTGSACAVLPTNGVPASGLPEVEYPAASPYVTAVGGTTLATNPDGSYSTELAWNAGGGGLSVHEGAPYWQNNVNPAAAGGSLGVARGVPDIAMDADLVSGAIVYDTNGSYFEVGGTSLAAPLSVGVWARLESTHGNRLGYATPALYGLYKAVNPTPTSVQPVASFHDIIAGCNGAYCAKPGYDFVTGLGSFDVAHINAAIR